MPNFVPSTLATWTGGRWTSTPSGMLTGFAIDSRVVRPGEVFVALKTGQRDGHAFLGAAQAAGAGAALVAVPDPGVSLPQLVVADPLAAFQAIAREHRRGFRGPVVAISGSAGKTSTKDFLSLLLGGPAGGVLATAANLNNHLGVPLTLTRLDPARHRFAVVEAGIGAPGEMKPLADMIAPDIAIITVVAPAHTQQLGGLAGVAREKSLLPRGLAPGGVALFPKSCLRFDAFQNLFVDQLVLERCAAPRPGSAPRHAIDYAVSQHPAETMLEMGYGAESPRRFRLRRVTDGMADNAALALAAALRLGIPADAIQERLAAWAPPALRGEVRRQDGRLLYLDCYNANPASMADALATFAAIAPPGEPRLYVIGCMEELGAEAAAHHHRLGMSLALRAEDRLFVTGTHAHEVCAGVLEHGDLSKQLQICSSLEPISAALADWRGSVFVKGSRRYQLEQVLQSAGSREVAHA